MRTQNNVGVSSSMQAFAEYFILKLLETINIIASQHIEYSIAWQGYEGITIHVLAEKSKTMSRKRRRAIRRTIAPKSKRLRGLFCA
jgi:hypothetical protein